VASWALSEDDLPTVQSMQVTLRSAKNDQRAEGSSWIFYKEEEEHDVVFIDHMALWAVQANSKASDPFISYRDKSAGNLFTLKYHGFNSVIKAAAKDCGFDPADFSTHSVRIGSLSQLTAAGVPLDAVQRAARHKSAVSTFKYQTTSVKERQQIVTALSSDSVFGVNDVQAVQGVGRKRREIPNSGRGSA
jgi:hypothetical protein